MRLPPSIGLVVLLGSSIALGEPSAREKMLIRYILHNEFVSERARLCEGRKDVSDAIFSIQFAEILSRLSKTDDATMRTALVFSLGTPGCGGYDPLKAREALRQSLESERNIWIKLDMARVLASLDDDSGKAVLVSALTQQEGYFTQSEMEVGKAVLPLLLLDYDFPGGFPTHASNYEWGGLRDYLNTIREERTTKPVASESGRAAGSASKAPAFNPADWGPAYVEGMENGLAEREHSKATSMAEQFMRRQRFADLYAKRACAAGGSGWIEVSFALFSDMTGKTRGTVKVNPKTGECTWAGAGN